MKTDLGCLKEKNRGRFFDRKRTDLILHEIGWHPLLGLMMMDSYAEHLIGVVSLMWANCIFLWQFCDFFSNMSFLCFSISSQLCNLQPPDSNVKEARCWYFTKYLGCISVCWENVFPFDRFLIKRESFLWSWQIFQHFSKTDSRFAGCLRLNCCPGLWQQWTGDIC